MTLCSPFCFCVSLSCLVPNYCKRQGYNNINTAATPIGITSLRPPSHSPHPLADWSILITSTWAFTPSGNRPLRLTHHLTLWQILTFKGAHAHALNINININNISIHDIPGACSWTSPTLQLFVFKSSLHRLFAARTLMVAVMSTLINCLHRSQR
jgi:hypothetical protein